MSPLHDAEGSYRDTRQVNLTREDDAPPPLNLGDKVCAVLLGSAFLIVAGVFAVYLVFGLPR